MRGSDDQTGHLFSYLSPEQRVPAGHPLRAIRQMTGRVLQDLSPKRGALYATQGRSSVSPEQLLRALLLQALYTIRSERLLIEQLEYNRLFRWLVGLAVDAPVRLPTTFAANRVRLIEGDIPRAFFVAEIAQAEAAALLSDEHLTVDGSLPQVWARCGQSPATPSSGHGSFRPTDDPPASGGGGGRYAAVDFRGQRRRDTTHRSTTDPDARLARKNLGQTSHQAYRAHVLLDDRHGLVREVCIPHATGTAEVDATTLQTDTAVPPRVALSTPAVVCQ